MNIIFAILSSQLGRVVAAAAAAFLFGWFSGFGSVPRVDIAAIERNTNNACDARWKVASQEAEEVHERSMQKALEASQRVVAMPAANAERVRTCAGDENCRRQK